MSDAGLVARRLSAAYFTYYATIGLEYVYMPFFFAHIGLSPADVGVLYAGRIATSIVAQPLTTRIADFTGRPYLALKLSMLMGFCCASGLYFAHSLATAAVFMWSQAAFRSVAIPVLDATTIHERGPDNYGRTRLWGSIGYGVAALGLASVVGRMAYDQAGATALPAYLTANAIMCLAMWSLPAGIAMQQAGVSAEPRARGIPAGVIAMMVFGAFHWSSVETYNVFFSSLVRFRGFDPDVPAFGVAMGIAAETATFYWFGSLLKRAPAARWILVSLALSILRWIGTALAASPLLLTLIQAGHAFSFALWWAAQLTVFGMSIGNRRRAAIQGLFTAGIMGVGGACGTTLMGRLMAHHGGQTTFLAAAALDVVAVTIALATRRLWWKIPTNAS